MVENLVRTSNILSAVKPAARPALVDRFITRTYEDGELLISQGQASDGLHLIASGEVVVMPVSYTHLRAHETVLDLACRLLLDKKKKQTIRERECSFLRCK